jgi:hypothetical protein
VSVIQINGNFSYRVISQFCKILISCIYNNADILEHSMMIITNQHTMPRSPSHSTSVCVFEHSMMTITTQHRTSRSPLHSTSVGVPTLHIHIHSVAEIYMHAHTCTHTHAQHARTHTHTHTRTWGCCRCYERLPQHAFRPLFQSP